jgi:hypothetical protein
MIYIIWILSLINIYYGAHYLLNALHILNNSKYSQGTTVLYAILFSMMGIGALIMLLMNDSPKWALLLNIGPWAIIFLILLFNMLTGDYK